MLRLMVLALMFLALPAAAQVTVIPGATTVVADTTTGLHATDDQSFRFRDGRLVVEAGPTYSLWSTNDGATWTQGPIGPGMSGYKTSLDFGGGEILSISRTSIKQPSGLYRLTQTRSLNNWSTKAVENASLTTPLAVEPNGDTCTPDAGAGLLVHHGLIQLQDGRLLATLYGNYSSDTTPAAGYPPSCGFNKYRVVAVESADKGLTWTNPVTVAHSGLALTTQEGFDESDLIQAPNGDLLVFMRTSGYSLPPQTPLYMARSRNLGRTWDLPVPVNSFGVNPHAVVLDNGAIVLTYGGDDGWIRVSTDSGYTWGTPVQLTTSESYTDLHALDADRVLSVYYNTSTSKFQATQNRIKRPFYAFASTLSVGQSAGLTWDISDARNCVLSGGVWGAGASVSTALTDVDTDPLLVPTTYVVRCERVSTPGVYFQHEVYVPVMQLSAIPATVSSGNRSTISWNLPDMRNCVLSGGAWGNGASVSASNSGVLSDPMTQDTTYMIRCESISHAGVFASRIAKVDVN